MRKVNLTPKEYRSDFYALKLVQQQRRLEGKQFSAAPWFAFMLQAGWRRWLDSVRGGGWMEHMLAEPLLPRVLWRT